MPQVKQILYLIIFLLINDLLLANENGNPDTKIQTGQIKKPHQYANPYHFDKWLFTITGFSGTVKSDFNLKYRLPYLKQNTSGQQDLYLLQGNKPLPGVGNGGGFQFGGFYKNWSFTSVGFDFPNSIHKDKTDIYNTVQKTRARITGALVFSRYTWKNKKKLFEPFVGLGYFSGLGPHMSANIDHFISYAPEINRYMYYSNQQVDVNVTNPFPKAGIKIKLPIQHWHIAPFYAYGFETVQTDVTVQPGSTFYAENPLEAPGRFINHIQNESLDFQLPFHFSNTSKKYHHRPGMSLYMDFRRFVSLRLFVFRNTNYNRWVVNGIFNLMFTPHIGITAFGEYGERELATIRYWMIGPTIVFQL